eukprot:TRINITY_DN23354_c0_g1_i2.p1 TRINITY_DN23354_c0_g1~~TRINITY_DN23354_c0_g1_i2.p1  ORF type:complete len:111 (-),score=22.87 TRINITY_DN23354_c0_g1_i2:112-444(-)
MIRRPPRSTQGVSSAASDVYKRQEELCKKINQQCFGISESGIGYDLDWTTIELTQKGFQTIFTINGEGLDLVRLHIDNITVPMYSALIPCLLYTSPSPRDLSTSRMPSSA